MIKIVWLVATFAAQGPITATVNERQTFKTLAECEEYGRTMSARMSDWIRGRMNADWDHPVHVKFACNDGAPT